VGVVRHDSEELQPGARLGPYELVAPVGAGGMARVWAARVRGKEDVVALKMLLPELAENVEFRKMFFDEAEISSRVRHPNVCSTFELAEHDGTLFIAMEWIDGPSVMRILRPGREDVTECARLPIRPRIAARIVADACAGLHAAHELALADGRSLGVVHRDVSPHNLLVTSAGHVKVTDFGVAKALGKSHMTIAGQLKGKVAYMAPEQLVGGTVDRRSDVFALGCVLYEITVGQRPFQGEHDPQVMASIMLGRMEPPRAVVPSYPRELEAIVLKALASEPDARYPSAEAMRVALEGYLRASGPSVGPAQVAALVKERCGDELSARAEAIRSLPPSPADAAWTENANGAFDSGSGAMAVEGGASASRRGLVWLALAAVVGAALGIGVLSYVRAARKPRPSPTELAAASEHVPALPVASATLATPSPAPAAAAPESALAGEAASSASGAVRLHIAPKAALVIVDGVVLPHGTDTIARPTDGSTISVLVRADKHADTIVLVDAATPDDVEVTLEPASAPVRTARDGGAARRVRADGGKSETPADEPPMSTAAPAGPETPPNPYE